MKNVKEFKCVACLGGGTIGSSWAAGYAMKGFKTYLYDLNEELLNVAMDKVKAYYSTLVKCAVMTEDDMEKAIGRIVPVCSIAEAVKEADFIQESGPERLAIKQSILEEIDQNAPADAIYASSTSGLNISDIAAKSKYAHRCVGGHPYNPPHLIPLVEITKGEKTDEAVVERAREFYAAIGKEPIVLNKECPGFVCNRIQVAVYREMQDLVLNGVCSVEDADRALTYGPGLRWAIMGHTMVLHLGSDGGVKETIEKVILPGADSLLEDMANWTTYPRNWGEIAQAGAERMMAAMPDEIGHTKAELTAYRDAMLIEELKLHKKL